MKSRHLQEPMFRPDSDWRALSLEELPSWKDAKRVCIDTETHDANLREMGPGVRRGSYIVGFSVAVDHGKGHYVPIRHEGGDNLDCERALEWLRHQAKTFTGELVGANLNYDLDFLNEEGVDFSAVRRFRDIQVNDPLIHELHKSYSLNEISQRYGVGKKETRLLEEAARAYGVDPKGGMWRLPARYVGPYAEADAELPLEVLERQEQRIDEMGLHQIYDLESRVIPVLVKMRRRGILIDQDKLSKIQEWSLCQEAAQLAEVKRLTGIEIAVGDVWKAEVIAKPLEYIGVVLGKTEKSGRVSVKKDILTGINHPVADALLAARKVNKLRTTFAESIMRYIIPSTGRIHCVFNQIAYEDDDGAMKGGRFGRLSAEHPNMQQQPSRDDFSKEWRSIYIPDEGAMWGCLDISQQEPRWLTHYAAALDLPRARDAAQRYIDDPTTDNHSLMAALVHGEDIKSRVSEEEYKGLRNAAKIIFLGLCYGEGGAKLCHDLQLPTRWAIQSGMGRDRLIEYAPNMYEARRVADNRENARVWEAAGEEGQRILDDFDGNVPYVRELARYADRRAKKNGFVITVGGRRCNFPVVDGNYDWTHKALNRIIQGSSADQVKKAMVEIDDAGYPLSLQVHDEVDASLESVEQGRAMAQIMIDCMPSRVPFLVDVEVGPNWGYIKKV